MRAPLVAPERFALFDRLIFAMFVVVLPAAIAGNARIFNDGDVSWHIAAGRWIIDHGRIPTTDPFSFTHGGQPWVAFEWGAEVLLAAAFNLAGYPGVSALVAAALLALFAILFAQLRPRVGPLGMLVALGAVALLIGQFTLARPHLIAWPFLAAWTWILIAARDRGSAPPLAAALLMFAWANIHGSFAIGFVIAGALGLDAMLASKWERRLFTRWALFGAASLAAALFNLNGLAAFLHPFTVSGMETLPAIDEWLPSSPARSPMFFAIAGAVLIALLVRRPRFTLGEALLLLVLGGLALTHFRHQAVLAIVGAMIVAPRLSQSRNAPSRGRSRPSMGWVAAAVAGVALAIGARLLLPLQPKENHANPWTAIAHIPPNLRGQPVFNNYSFGGPLILSGVRPFIDGRADMYGDALVVTYVKIVNGDRSALDQIVERYDIGWTMLRSGSAAADMVDRSPGWERVHADEVAVIHRRRDQSARR